MIIHNKSKTLSIYFGNCQDPFIPGRYDEFGEAFGLIGKQLQAKSLSLLQQTHSTKGYVIDSFERFVRDGDYLVTNTPGCAVGVLTADCLPVILYDSRNHTCAIIHAGWIGSIHGIVEKTVNSMMQEYGTKPIDICVWFGPSAKSCCYEVQDDFYRNVKKHNEFVFLKRNNKLFFDNVMYNYQELLECGILAENIVLQYNVCTICNFLYHSYRRSGENSGRQLTAVVLNSLE